MNDAPEDDGAHAVVALERILAAIVVVLSAKGIADVVSSPHFPRWFGPVFALGVAGILLVLLWFVLGRHLPRTAPTRATEVAAWALLGVSFVATTSLHAFEPFRADVAEAWAAMPSLRLNLVIAGAGLFATIVLASLHFRGRRALAGFVLVALAPLLLIPNDDCANPFNFWWIDRIGASPLMYVPNVMAILVLSSLLRGKRPRLGLWMLAGICLATLALGMSHRTRIVW